MAIPAKLFLISFDTDKKKRSWYDQHRKISNRPLPARIYDAVDAKLKNIGAFHKPVHQIRLLLTVANADTIHGSLRPLLRGQPIIVVELAKDVDSSVLNLVPHGSAQMRRWLKHDFTQAEIHQSVKGML